ncbi:CPBP family intramembrane glutamic endopeptidase [Luteococcus peritonei]|uniref:CPBP family intramembrane glutamic endopeptidase n=1 Tax=Luteococcus peritonei TaxID=88874 RepID=A0ABW4RWL5_9ACTN
MADVNRPAAGLRSFLHASLLDTAEMHGGPVSPYRPRCVCALTLVAGAAVLAWSLRIPAGDPAFYLATLALAAVWAVGARLSGPLPLAGRAGAGARVGDELVRALVVGLVLLMVFVTGAVLVAQLPGLATPVQELLDHARQGSLPLVALLTALNGLAEELFFRGALFAALPRGWQLAGSTILYTVVTAMSGIPLLAFAALVLGVVVGLQRRATAGCLAPVVTHLVWSLGMLLLLGPTLSLAARILS